jgi:putative oligomerization/nucleic acid binding protein/phospholipase D-like protein
LLVANYTFASFLWDFILIMAFVIWFWLLITVFSDLFRRHDIGGGAKTLWVIFVIILPYLGVFIYLISQHQGMADRNMKMMQAQKEQMDDYVRSVASSSGGGAAAEIERAKGLLDSGAITQAEFDSIKAKALAQG